MKLVDFGCCKICGAAAEPKYSISWNGSKHRIFKCQTCDFHYLDYVDDESGSNEIPENISPDDFEYIEKSLQSNEQRFLWQSDVVCSYVRGESPRVLDIGSGGGKFLALMRDRGAVPMGIEPNGVRVRFARDRYGLETDQRLINNDHWQRGYAESFEAVSLWDVIEHVNDPKTLLEDATNLLCPGGYLFIDTPMRESIYYKLGEWSYRISGGRRPLFLRSMYSPTLYAHKQIFTREQLARLLDGMGMKVRRLESFHELSFPYSFYLERLIKSRKLADGLAPFANTFFSLFRIRNKMLVVAQKLKRKASTH